MVCSHMPEVHLVIGPRISENGHCLRKYFHPE
jgi:hypothetical protein